MAELKLISPLLSNMEVVECLSVRGAAAVYIVKSTKSGQTYILKHISVPESQKQVDALMFTGAAATTEDAQKYYEHPERVDLFRFVSSAASHITGSKAQNEAEKKVRKSSEHRLKATPAVK